MTVHRRKIDLAQSFAMFARSVTIDHVLYYNSYRQLIQNTETEHDRTLSLESKRL